MEVLKGHFSEAVLREWPEIRTKEGWPLPNMEIASFRPALRTTQRSIIKPLASNVEGQYQYSNRQSYEKLEVDLTPVPSIKVPFLIDTKTHFVQGKNAQF